MQAGAAAPWFVDSIPTEAALMPAVFRRLLPGDPARRARLPRRRDARDPIDGDDRSECSIVHNRRAPAALRRVQLT
jgi:hypothetical protein